MIMEFLYGEKETDYLRQRDRRLGSAIDAIGHISRPADPDLFSSVVHQIIGQQISARAQETIWNRLQEALGMVDARTIADADPDFLQSLGISSRKVGYIRAFAFKVRDGSYDMEEIRQMDDAAAIERLTSLQGVGVWTAEMILLFCLQRPDILSFHDYGIRRGLCILYHHRKMTRELFEKYRRRYHPYGSVASLYLWAIAQGVVPGLDVRNGKR